jgi:hypothetical protein
MLTSSQQKLKANLPRIAGRRRPSTISSGGLSPQQAKSYADYVQGSLHVHKDIRVNVPENPVDLSLKIVNVSELPQANKNRKDFEASVRHIMQQYHSGKTIPPILIHKENGRWTIKDGNARVEAYRRLGVTRIPAVENSLSDVLSHVGHLAGRAIRYTATHAIPLAKRAVKFGVRAAKFGARSAGEIGASYKAGKEATLRGTRERPKGRYRMVYVPEEE